MEEEEKRNRENDKRVRRGKDEREITGLKGEKGDEKIAWRVDEGGEQRGSSGETDSSYVIIYVNQILITTQTSLTPPPHTPLRFVD